MSTKTLRKRIALVAVSALTAGLFSVVSAPVANASTDAPVAGKLHLATQGSTTGAAVLALTFNDAATGTYADEANGTSVGFVSATTAAAAAAGATGYALTNAELAFVATTATDIAFTVSGGYISQATSTASAVVIASDNSFAFNDTAEATAVAVKPNGPAGSTMTVELWTGAGVDATVPKGGSLIASYTFVIVAAGSSGVYNASESSVNLQAAVAKGTACSSLTPVSYDVSERADNAEVACIYVDLEDAYGANLTTGTLSASSTNSANLEIGGGASDGYVASAAYDSASYSAATWVSVTQPSANTAGSTTVTISWNGIVVGTKTINWNGVGTTIALVASSSASIFSRGFAATDGAVDVDGRNLNVVYVVKDAAGNAIEVANAASTISVSDATGSMVGAILDQTDTTGTAAAGNISAVLQTKSLGYGVATMEIPSNSQSGAGTYTLKYVNALGATVKSAPINATVSSGAASFTASWDKAQYATGDIATLTITVKDSSGNLIADGVALGTGSLVTTNTDGLTSVTSACDATNIATTTYSGGSKVCKFAVKNTAGSYAFTAKVATSADQAAVGGTLKVVDASGSVSNAEVLKSIVALIASINKQIQALQKLILRR
jgi:trimeric autotransporter adhesin